MKFNNFFLEVSTKYYLTLPLVDPPISGARFSKSVIKSGVMILCYILSEPFEIRSHTHTIYIF